MGETHYECKEGVSRADKQATLTDEGLLTLICLAEGIVNNRSITTVSSDPDDLETLTPNIYSS